MIVGNVIDMVVEIMMDEAMIEEIEVESTTEDIVAVKVVDSCCDVTVAIAEFSIVSSV